MPLTVEQSNYYDILNELFGTPGWKQLVEEWTSEIYHLQADALDLSGPDKSGRTIGEQQQYIKGRAEQLAYLTRLEEVSDRTKQMLEESTDVM